MRSGPSCRAPSRCGRPAEMRRMIGAARSQEEPAAKDALLRGIETRSAKIGIVGLGYVGIPLALATARAGFCALGFDIDGLRVAQINGDGCSLKHVAADEIRGHVAEKRLEATSDFTRPGEPDAILICVPTPLTRHREPDLSFVVKTTEAIAA